MIIIMKPITIPRWLALYHATPGVSTFIWLFSRFYGMYSWEGKKYLNPEQDLKCYHTINVEYLLKYWTSHSLPNLEYLQLYSMVSSLNLVQWCLTAAMKIWSLLLFERTRPYNPKASVQPVQFFAVLVFLSSNFFPCPKCCVCLN